jgi:hypothetical protein
MAVIFSRHFLHLTRPRTVGPTQSDAGSAEDRRGNAMLMVVVISAINYKEIKSYLEGKKDK